MKRVYCVENIFCDTACDKTFVLYLVSYDFMQVNRKSLSFAFVLTSNIQLCMRVVERERERERDNCTSRRGRKTKGKTRGPCLLNLAQL